MRVTPLSKVLVLSLHHRQIQMFGGSDGLNSESMLDSALTQPYVSFDGKDLYASIEEKAARYAYGIIKNHPFNDGNKRTGAAAMVAFLKVNGFSFSPNHKEFEMVIVGVASGELGFEDLVSFVSKVALPETR